MLYEYLEKDLIERIERAQEQGKAIKTGDADSTKLFEQQLTYILSRHYNIPFFSSYFKERTLDELVLEVELIKKELPPEAEAQRLLNNNPDEVSGLFDDMVEVDSSEFMKEAEQFMTTGEFKNAE